MPISAGEFYETYHGHEVPHLAALHSELRQAGVTSFAFLAGDSSLDNKHWFFTEGGLKREEVLRKPSFVDSALNKYELILKPPVMVKDVAYWLNKECSQHLVNSGQHVAALNCAVEESGIHQREIDELLPQDVFIRDNITENDILIVDVGGNDVALRPTPGVIFNMLWLLYLTPQCLIRNTGPWGAWGLHYFINLFSTRLQSYIEKITEKRKPRLIIVCMIYFPDERPGGSWADGVLEKLGYNTNPAKLQDVIRQVYHHGVCQIEIPGSNVRPLPLYETLNGKDSTDYTQRVEPSVKGGSKMARAIAQKMFGEV